ncbi:NAD-dependent epimerase/dehydratase family protein [Aeoliella mucimassa]|uniref:3 beta-hydroxysteroid dehydrogenase/Delta 5-->4-isomerase n=1 Tax=Aeoliella mucimassa TaxID=2527972 RepID=A0A518ASP4_9BACT|nr:NAD-dependent epimerase/dehydratase family protein [Aeoliella mucimassa]QDU57748.1 3 beta-hydroxysteroid dehydrogenase/Delta 5-->4-isomerase [Aeoliella mucimassa]
MSGKTVLVTGATGLVGQCVVKKACEAGYHVQAMVRANSDRSSLEGTGVEFVVGDLADTKSLEAVVQQAEVVVHAAAHIGDWGPAEKYRAINVMALEYLLNAAMRTGKLERWIQISSLGVYPAQHHHGTDESTPPSLTGLDGYTRTKAEAEVLIRQYIEEHGLRAVILRPGFIYGPGERHSIPRVIEKLNDGSMKFIGPGDKVLNNTYVGNLADAVLLAIESDSAIGETFNIRDARLVTREEYINTIADYLGKPHPKHVPEWLARLLVRPIERIAKLRGATEAPLLTGARIKFMTLNLDYSIAKAKRVLGYRPQVDFREGIHEALDDLCGQSAT